MQQELIIETAFEIVEPLFMRLAEKRILAAGGAVTDAGFGVSPDAFGTYHMRIVADAETREAVLDVLVTEFPVLAITIGDDHIALGHEAGVVATKFGDVHIVDRVWRGRVIGVSPSLPDCSTLAKRFNVSGSMVWREAIRLAEARVGLRRDSD